jgi:DNA-binding MarR family transcriptional regulator
MDDRRQDLLALLLPLTRDLRRIEEAAAGEHGLTMWQYAILSVADRRPGWHQAAIADALGYSKNRIVGDIDHLEGAGLLTRSPGADRRANVLTVTTAGRRAMRAIQREIHRHEDALLAPLSESARQTFVTALRGLDQQVRGGVRPAAADAGPATT